MNLLYLGYNTVLRTLEIRHYGPVCDVSETDLYITEIVFSSAFQKSIFQRHRMKAEKNLATRRHFDFSSSFAQNVSPPTFADG